MNDLIKVAVRVRPLIKRELDQGSEIRWNVERNEIGPTTSSTVDRRSATYTYDHVFGMECSNRQVYEESVQEIVRSAMQGYNGTIFAYGQTSSGKTYTILGEPNASQEMGVIGYAVEEIFSTINSSPSREYLLRVSYLEIYQEDMLDLLSGKREPALKIRENPAGEVFTDGIVEEIVMNSEQILRFLLEGQKNRHVGETNMNERSSRSHTIFSIVIESRELQETENVDGAVIVSRLNIVDLAGSERAGQAGATGERLKEGIKINQSLSALARVISQLSEKEDFVSFRDSKLTRILKNSLGGNARTCVICTVTPIAVEETHSTLKFASRAKRIQNKPMKNEVLTDEALLKKYQKEQEHYRKEIDKLKEQLEQARSLTGLEELQTKNEALFGEIERYKGKMDRLQKLVLIGTEEPSKEKSKYQSLKSRRQTWCPGLLSKPFAAPTPVRVRSFANISSEEFKDVCGSASPFDVMAAGDLMTEFAEAEKEKEAEFVECAGDTEMSKIRLTPLMSDDVFESPGSVAVPKKRSRIVGFAQKLETVAERIKEVAETNSAEFVDSEAQTEEIGTCSKIELELKQEVDQLKNEVQDLSSMKEKLEESEAKRLGQEGLISGLKLKLEMTERSEEEYQAVQKQLFELNQKDVESVEVQTQASDESSEKIAELETEVQRLQKESDDQQMHLAQLELEKSEESRNYQELLRLSKEELSAKEEAVRSSEDKLKALEGELKNETEKNRKLVEDAALAKEELDVKIKENERTVDEKQKELDLMAERAKTLETELSEVGKGLEEDLKERGILVEQTQKELQSVGERAEKLEAELTKVREELEQSTKEQASLLEEKQKDFDFATDRAQVLETELAKTREELVESEKKFSELEGEVRELRERSRLWTEESTTAPEHTDNVVQTESSSFMNDSSALTPGVEQKLREMGEQIGVLEEEKAKLMEVMEAGVDSLVQAELQRIAEENQSLTARLDSATAELEKLRNQASLLDRDESTPTGDEEIEQEEKEDDSDGIIGDATLKSGMFGELEWTQLSQDDKTDTADLSVVAQCRSAFFKHVGVGTDTAIEVAKADRSMVTEIQDAPQETEELRKLLLETEKRKEEAVELCDRLVTERDQLSIVIKDLEKSSEALRLDLENTSEQLGSLRNQLMGKEESYVQLECFQAHELAAIEDAREANKILEEKCHQLEADLEFLRQQQTDVTGKDFWEEYNSMKKTTEDAQGLALSVKEELAVMQSSLKEESEKYTRLREENANLKKRAENAERDVKDYEWMMEETKRKNQERLNGLVRRVAELEDQTEPPKKETEEFGAQTEEDGEHLRKRIEEKESEIEMLREQVRLRIEQLDSRTEAALELEGRLKEIEDTRDKELAEKNAELDAAQAELKDVMAQLAESAKALGVADNQKDELERKLEDVQKIVEESQLTEQQLRLSLTEAESRLNEDRGGKDGSSEELKKARSDLATSLMKLEQMESVVITFHETKTKLAESRSQVTQLEERIQSLMETQAQLEAQTKRVEELEEQVLQLSEVSKEQLIQSEEAISEKAEEIRCLEEKLQDVQGRLDSVQRSAQDAAVSTLESIRQLNEEVERLQQSAESSETAQKDKEIADLNAEVEKLRRVECLLRNSKRRLEDECDKADEMEERYQKEVAEKDELVSQLQNEVEKMRSAVGAAEKELERLKKEHEKDSGERRVEAMHLGMKAADLERTLRQMDKDKKKEIKILKAELEHREGRIRNLKNELRSAQEQGAESTIRVQRAHSEATLARKRSEDEMRPKTKPSTESATGSGIVDALVLHAEKQKNYEMSKKLQELEKKIKRLQTENLELRNASLTEQKENSVLGTSVDRSTSAVAAGPAAAEAAIVQSSRKQDPNRSGFRIPTPLRGSQKKRQAIDSSQMATPVHKTTAVLHSSQKENQGEVQQKKSEKKETPTPTKTPKVKTGDSPAQCRQQ